MKKAEIEVYEDMEQKGSYLVFGTKEPILALAMLENEYPECKGIFDEGDAKDMIMHKCLDCGSYWNSDDVCGECGEYRLSKREENCYYFDRNLK